MSSHGGITGREYMRYDIFINDNQGLSGLKKYYRNNNTIAGRLEDEFVMLDIDRGKYFSLNPVASRIWEILELSRGLDEICEKLREEYDVEEIKCRTETKNCLSEMVELGLLSESED